MIDVNLNEQVLNTVENLRPEFADDNIFFSLVLFTDLWMVRVDPEEIRKMLATLLASSCQSLPGGGRVSIETANLPMSMSGADGPDGHAELIPGDYVRLLLSDTGGSLPEIANRRLANRVNEGGQTVCQSDVSPSSTYDFVRKSGGEIIRYRGHEKGTTVSLYLPRCRVQTEINRTLPPLGSPAMR